MVRMKTSNRSHFPLCFKVAATVLLLAQGATAQDSGFNDGIPDAWREQYFGSNSGDNARAGALADPGRDGANNYLEFITGTDPTDRESFDRSPAWVSTYVGSE